MGRCTIIRREDGSRNVIDARFLMGSMGHVVGERIARAMWNGRRIQKLPVILFCCSGGATYAGGYYFPDADGKDFRSFKTAFVMQDFFIFRYLTDPTTGGVTASFAMLGDIILAEPGALIGFAGPRVIEQTIGEKLPEGFQRAEFQLEHGFVDAIVERDESEKIRWENLFVQMHRPIREGYANFDPCT